MTNPGLNKGLVKRAPAPTHHIYAFHGVSSIHQNYELHGLDHFDSLLCVGPYQIVELRKMEELYGLPPRELPLIGYPYIERIFADHQLFKSTHTTNQRPMCLIAPTWDPKGEASILDNCIEALIDEISQINMDFIIRPHPEFTKRFKKKVASIKRMVQKHTQITVETAPNDPKLSLHQADVLITDHSTISFDFFLGTERPVLFIDTPTRIDNEEGDRLQLEVVEKRYRAQLGGQLAVSDLSSLKTALAELLAQVNESAFKHSVHELRELLLANWQHSAELGASFIISHCR
jgi:YidC/Oxa1 family membrane protein insertase